MKKINKSIETLIQITIVLTTVKILAQKDPGVIYMLEWAPPNKEPFINLGMGQEPFKKCAVQNCFLIENQLYLPNITDYDAILFNIYDLKDLTKIPDRTEDQVYVLVGVAPKKFYPVPMNLNAFFNMSWTYKLSSDVPSPFIIVKNHRNVTVGPRKDMEWISVKYMSKIDGDIKTKLKKKKIAAAWLSANCGNENYPYNLVLELQSELSKHNHRLDIFGECGNVMCDDYNCVSRIEADYYFYLAFESFLGEDYVTEQLLYALNQFAVPVVYGKGNYTRFMPDGIYIDMYELGPSAVAKEMTDIIADKARYQAFFKWHGHYSYHIAHDEDYRDSLCELCSLLNDKTVRERRVVYMNAHKWWSDFDVTVRVNLKTGLYAD